jgi:manganese/zinc/iron transport system permease protein
MLEKDLIVSGIGAALLLLTVFVFYRPFKLISFNREYALSIGLPVRLYEFLMSTLTIIAVAIGIQAVGIVLMAALLITPAAAARYWTQRLPIMLLLSGIFAALSGFLATWVSFSIPSMPTGPWVIVILSIIAIGSIFFAPARGLFWQRKLRKGHERKILLENILKTFYYVRSGDALEGAHSEKELMTVRAFEPQELRKGLGQLARQNLVISTEGKWRLTDKGLERCVRIVRLHRLWELFLNKRLQLKPDHVHHGAEAIEHIITPEIEELLSSELGHPERDPHQKEIPGTYGR